MYSECHGHIFMDGHNYKQAMALHREGIDKKVINDRLQALSNNRVVYYRDGGDILGTSLYARSVAASYGIEYRSCAFATHKKGCYGWIVGRGFSSAAEFYQLVLEAKRQGADFIKLMISGIIDFKTFGGLMGGGLETGEISELIKIAHGEGFAVMSHVNGAEAIKTALQAGVDSIEHGYFMDEECLSLLAETGAVWVPTLAATAGFINREGFDAAVVDATILHQRKCIQKAEKLGILVAAGSDAGAYGVSPESGIITEHELLRQAGLGEDYIARGDAAVREIFKFEASSSFV